MKRWLCAILIFALVGVAVCCLSYSNGNFARAEANINGLDVKLTPIKSAKGELLGASFEVGDRTVYLYAFTNGDNLPIGVRFSGYYFGESGIAVVADVYSSDNFTIDFNIGEQDSKLTATQISTRNAIVKLFSNVSQMIDSVDGYANTTYDGVANSQKQASDVYRYNQAKQGETVEIAKETYEMLTLAREMYETTGGAFNPAVYRLVDLWGFSSRIYSQGKFGLKYDREVTADEFFEQGYPLPDGQYVDAFSHPNFTDFSQNSVKLTEDKASDKYYVTKNVAPAVVEGVEYQQWIDLGGIAKGYAVDRAREMIAELNIDRFYVNAGSSSIATGLEYDGGNTALGMENAFQTYTSLLELEIGKSSVSTSGQNIRKYTVNGVEYAHIIDGVTGAPAQTGVRSVMVVVPEEAGSFWATKGDCLTTALTVMGRDRIVEFVNGYLKENGIKIVVQYETLEGKKQLLTNYSEGDIRGVSDSYEEFGWALKQNGEGDFYYDANAKAGGSVDTYRWILITLGCILGAGAVALVVYHFLRGKNRTARNVQNAKKDKPFKAPDVMVYLCVVLLILVLFFVFIFDTEDAQLQVINVIDDETGETLFVYNVKRGEYTVNDANSNGWTVEVEQTAGGVEVTLRREVKGEQHYNKMAITRGSTTSVKMVEAVCGFHKDCVRNFPAIKRAGGAIVCSPNRLKIVTE